MKTHEIRKLALRDIEDAPYNPRTISDEARKGLGESIHAFGLIEMPVVNEHGGRLRLIGGHRRVEQLRADDVTHADCIVVDFDPADEMAANLALNSHSIRGRFDAHKLPSDLLDEIGRDLPTPDFAGFNRLMDDLRAKSGYAEAQRKLQEQTGKSADDATVTGGKQVRSKPGTVYQLGNHRLYCGSYEDGIKRMFAPRVLAAVTITDPPYGEDYVARSGETVTGDSPAEWSTELATMLRTIVRKTDQAVYMFCSSRWIGDIEKSMEQMHASVWRWLVWAKDRPTTQFPNFRGDYHHQCEFIMFGGTGEAPNVGVRPNVLEVPKPRQNELHPTQKPASLIRTLMQDSTDAGDIVFDPFAGSGTTLVVAEELGRVCYASEIEPAHCDTIRMRWAQQVHGDIKNWTKLTAAVK